MKVESWSCLVFGLFRKLIIIFHISQHKSSLVLINRLNIFWTVPELLHIWSVQSKEKAQLPFLGNRFMVQPHILQNAFSYHYSFSLTYSFVSMLVASNSDVSDVETKTLTVSTILFDLIRGCILTRSGFFVCSRFVPKKVQILYQN